MEMEMVLELFVFLVKFWCFSAQKIPIVCVSRDLSILMVIGGWVLRNAMDGFFKNCKGTTFDFWLEMEIFPLPAKNQRNLEIFPENWKYFQKLKVVPFVFFGNISIF